MVADALKKDLVRLYTHRLESAKTRLADPEVRARRGARRGIGRILISAYVDLCELGARGEAEAVLWKEERGKEIEF